MGKEYLLESKVHNEDICVSDLNAKIDFKSYQENLVPTYANIYLYEVDEGYYEKENSEKNLVATIDLTHIDLNYIINEGLDIVDMLDMINGDTESLIEYLIDDDGELKEKFQTYYNNIFYLDRITVLKNYRNQGVGTFLLKNLQNIISNVLKMEYGLIVVQAQPFDTVDGKEIMIYDDKERLERLIKLYVNCGFQKIDNSNYLYIINE